MTDPFSTDSERRRPGSEAEPTAAPPDLEPGEKRRIPERRIRHARETKAALREIRVEPTRANVVAWHELHASHLREKGHEDAAELAEERARRARESAIVALDWSSYPPRVRWLAAADDAGGSGLLDEVPPIPAAGPGSPAEATQVQHARAASQRADAALQRAGDASERANASEARAKAGRARSAAAQRRLSAAEARTEASGARSPLRDNGEDRIDERDRAADERERIADERERLADERDKEADQRDKTADRREKAADERDRTANKRQRFLDTIEGPRERPR